MVPLGSPLEGGVKGHMPVNGQDEPGTGNFTLRKGETRIVRKP